MIRPLTGALAVLAVAAPAASASERPLAWRDCDGGFECATAKVPLDHDRPHGRSIELALIRFPAQSAAIEHGLHRFFAACVVHRAACGFGGDDPEDAFADLVARLDGAPLSGVDGDDLRFTASSETRSPRRWPRFAAALAAAQAGDGGPLRALTDLAYERTPAGDSPTMDVLWATLANDQRYPRAFEPFLAAGRHAAAMFDHAYFNSGYGELAFGQLPVQPRDTFTGPFSHAANATPALVIGTTHDTNTPFAWSRRLVADLGNARLLTFRGDGHDVLTSLNPCVLGALLAYLEDLTLPAPGTVCVREAPFGG